MKVLVESTLSKNGSSASIETNPTNSVDSVIVAFCIQTGITFKKNYVLRNQDLQILDPVKTLGASGVISEDVLFLGHKYMDDDRTFGVNNWIILSVVALLIGLAGIVAVSYYYASSDENVFYYGVVLDAGSSKTQLYVYKWGDPKTNETGLAKELANTKCPGDGIDKYADNPGNAGPSLQPCLDFAQEKVPDMYKTNTPLFLGATAGMRLLEAISAKGAEESRQILESIRSTFAHTSFSFSPQNARIISGEEEGAFSWLTVNYLLKSFGEIPGMFRATSKTTGALDLGGASTQITFQPENGVKVPPDYSESLTVFGSDYDIYTHSYLCYGKNEATRRYQALLVQAAGDDEQLVIKNPCGPIGNVTTDTVGEIFQKPCVNGSLGEKAWGYAIDIPPHLSPNQTVRFEGTSNVTECQAVVPRLFNFSSCSSHSENCTFNNVYQPQLHGNYMAFAGYFYTADFFNASKTSTTLQEFNDTVNAVCNKSWSELEKYAHPFQMAFLPFYCFDGQYVLNILTRGYKFNEDNWQSLKFVNTLHGTSVGWSLGYMLNATNTIPSSVPQKTINAIEFGLLLSLFLVFVCISAGFAYYARKSSSGSWAIHQQMKNSYGTV